MARLERETVCPPRFRVGALHAAMIPRSVAPAGGGAPNARPGRRRNGTSPEVADSIDAAARVNGTTVSPPTSDHEPIEILLVDDTPDKLLALEAALGEDRKSTRLNSSH